MKLNNYQ